MGLRRKPKEGGRFGVHWTQWFFPSQAAAAIYRKFFEPSAAALDPYTRDKILRRLRIFYFMFAWTVFGVASYHFFKSPEDAYRDLEGRPVHSSVYYGITRLDRKQVMDEDAVIKSYRGNPFKGWEVTVRHHC